MSLHRLTLTPRHRRELVAAARSAHPEECCGVLLGRSGNSEAPPTAGVTETVVESVLPAVNLSPDRRSAYVVDPEAILQALELARGAGLSLVGFYHSHPDGSRRPSRLDRRNAWPDVSYVIVPRGGEVTSWRRRQDGAFTAERLVECSTRRAVR